MSIMLILALAGFLAVAEAQVPPVGDAESMDATEEQPLPAVEEDEPLPSEESLEESPSPETPTQDLQVDDSDGDPAAMVEEDIATEASAQEEFNPDEEISEDYPVPLPSDI